MKNWEFEYSAQIDPISSRGVGGSNEHAGQARKEDEAGQLPGPGMWRRGAFL